MKPLLNRSVAHRPKRRHSIKHMNINGTLGLLRPIPHAAFSFVTKAQSLLNHPRRVPAKVEPMDTPKEYLQDHSMPDRLHGKTSASDSKLKSEPIKNRVTKR